MQRTRFMDTPESVLTQPNSAHLLTEQDRNALIVSLTKIDGHWCIMSRYGDDEWVLMGAPTNSAESRNKINFLIIPEPFRAVAKLMIYRYMRKGRGGGRRPRPGTLTRAFLEISYFLRYVQSLGIDKLDCITPIVCSQYVHMSRSKRMQGDDLPTTKTVYRRVMAVENVYLLSHFTNTPLPAHPWPDSSAHKLAGVHRHNRGKVTPLMPDDVFTRLFQEAWRVIQDAHRLLDMRDEMERLAQSGRDSKFLRGRRIKSLGFCGTYEEFKSVIVEIRTACYIVIASLSGCRHHELAYLHMNSCRCTEDDDGEQYWWMSSISTKTYEGLTEWMVPEAAVFAIEVLERWSEPYQARLLQEIAQYRESDPTDLRIGIAEQHIGAIFVGMDSRKKNIVRTLSTQALNANLREFAQSCGLDWEIASHQFRRKFANYAARSQFGDLRYLKEHFKHWSMDMTLGYALNESQEMALYLEILDEVEEIKEGVVASWLDESEPLAGGYGSNLVDWRARGESITLFKSHSAMVQSIAQSTPIRSNGHAWCTADDTQCVGNTLEKSRCGKGCDNAAIGRPFVEIYVALFNQSKELFNAEDVGPGGRMRATSDLAIYGNVLVKLGYDINIRHEL